MDVKTIINMANTKSNVILNPVQGRKYINEAMSILASKYDTACVKKEINFNADSIDNLEFDVPSDFIGIIRCKDSSNLKYKKYTVDNISIKFDDIGTYSVEYMTIPILVSKENYDFTIGDDVPPINPSYHVAISFYLASMSLINDTDPAKNSNLMVEFYQLANDINNKLNNAQRKSVKKIHAPVWR